MKIKKGDKIPSWASGRDDGLSTVLDILPYTGNYKEYFNCVLVLTSERTRKGSIEMAYKNS